MHKDEFIIAIVGLVVAVILLLGIGTFLLFASSRAVMTRSGGCNGIPIVNGQPAYPCNNAPPP